MKKFAIIIGISSLLLLTSCVKMDINQTINKDGVSKINATVDMSAFLKMSESMSKMDTKNSS